MAITRIKNNQVTDASAGNIYLGINAAVKLQDYSVTAGKIANSLVYGSDLTVTGNLTVNGQTTTIDTVSVVIEDPILYLAANQTGSPSLDIGFIGERGTSQNIAFVWDESAGEFVTVYTNDTTTNSTVTIASYADFHTNNANIGGNIVINGTTSLVGNIISDVAITGNLSAGNISTPGLISAVGNISGQNLNAVANVETANLRVTSMTANRVVFTGEDDYLITTQQFTFDGFIANLQGILVVDNFTIDSTNITSNANVTITSNANEANIDITPVGNAGVVNINNIFIANNTIGSSTGNIILDPAVSIKLPDETASAVLYLTTEKEIESSSNFVYDGTTANIQGDLVVDNVNINGNEISTTDTDGNLTLNPNGTGWVVVDALNSSFTGNLETAGNALIGGNLIVQGNITYINIDDLRVEDPIIILGTGANGAPLTTNDGKDRGVFMEYYTTGLGNAFVGWDNSSGNMIIANDAYFTGNDVVGINAYGTLEVGNVFGESAVFIGNVNAGNLISDGAVIGNVEITGNLELGNLSVAGIITATGNITGGNLVSNAAISAATTINATGNITGGNILTGGQLVSTQTGNSATGASQLYLNGSGNNRIDYNTNGTAAPAFTTRSAGTKVTLYPALSGSTTDYALGIDTATLWSSVPENTAGFYFKWYGATTEVANLSGTGVFSAVGNINSDGNIRATGNVTGANLILTTGIIDGPDVDRITINGSSTDTDFAVNSDTVANVFYVDAGTGTVSFGSETQTTGAGVAFNYTDSILAPVGNTAQRPTGVTGMVRFNTTTSSLEFYDSTQWVSTGTIFTVVQSQTFDGDGNTVAFTINAGYTTASCLVAINGILQVPVTAYAVSGTTLTFTEAPAIGDLIEVREITTTVAVKGITNANGSAVIEVSDTNNYIQTTGNIIPSGNVLYNLGSDTARFKDLFLSGSSITLGNIVLKNESGNTLAFYGPDGTTPGVLSSNNVDTTSIANGNASVQTWSSSGNVSISAGGTSNVFVADSQGIHVTGNIELTGNIVANQVLSVTAPLLYLDHDYNYPYDFDIGFYSGFVGGPGNIYQHTGVVRDFADNEWKFFSNVAEPVGNVVEFTSNTTYDTVAMGQLRVNLMGNATAIVNGSSNGVGNIGSASTYFNTVFAKATSAQYADLAENYEADAGYEPGTVVCFGGTKEVTVCNTEDCTRVAGVISTNPSYLMNSGQTGAHVAAVALQGRVPTKVTGQIRKGDLIVSAGDGRGRANNDARAGTIIGKALADFDGQDGVIEVVVGRV